MMAILKFSKANLLSDLLMHYYYTADFWEYCQEEAAVLQSMKILEKIVLHHILYCESSSESSFLEFSWAGGGRVSVLKLVYIQDYECCAAIYI